MSGANKSKDIGLRQGRRLCGMSGEKRLKFIAQGLSVILDSARSLLKASRALKDYPREAEVLERQAEEESAKVLILIDIIRCPPKLVASRTGSMMDWFYDHLARLLYAKAQSWKPVSVKQLQEYVDGSRRSHYLEGQYGEYIMPNWELFNREFALYADVICDEDSEPAWCSPLREPSPDIYSSYDPISYSLAEGLEASGAFTEGGVKILREVWGSVDFGPDLDGLPARDLFWEMAQKLQSAGLVDESRLTDQHIHNLRNNWQIPMYHIDFSPIPVDLDELRQERDSQGPDYY